ncbi:metal ABC transporter substrate-binding protein [Puerhibacterium puerhi]|uniref:metal ABC transporter substrate-binding protein n=1 Tax=Puerhibacterium puerhi TaxID=2692623 RepID=UPI0013584882|nr:metal ABC transporter substrate-binding protein [Puerhibacterium puerhi]
MHRRPPALLAVPALALPLALAACSSGSGGSDDGTVRVLASFYPLQYVAQQVGGAHVQVDNLTPPAAEPHDLELSPAQVREIGTADVVLYLSGFQSAVDEGVEARQPQHVVDAADVVTLEAHASSEEASPEDAEHESGDGHDHEALGDLDPHFWTDPTLLAQLAAPVAEQLAAADPDHAADYEAGATALQEKLAELDAEYAEGLAACSGATLVTSHTAFGYLAERYGLEQVGISALDPEAEPSPARLREIGAVVAERGVSTLFSETLVGPKVTETLAADLGVDTAVLDPLEGLSQDALASGEDYVSVMQSNLEALEQGLVCG